MHVLVKSLVFCSLLAFFCIFLSCKGHHNEPKPENPAISKSREYVANGISFVMVNIAEAKKILLGNNSDEENKEHTVSLSAYAIGETEVTQELYMAVMKENPSNFDGSTDKKKVDEGETQEKRPVEKVSWFKAIVFCNELTKAVGIAESECVYYSDSGMTKVYTKEDADKEVHPFFNTNKKGFSLPTEAQWEWVALAGEKTIYAGTSDIEQLKNYAWITSNSNNKTHEVKKKMPNKLGLYDLSGNVWEWCYDWHSAPIDTSTEQDPLGPKTGLSKVWKGGSYADGDADECKCYFRASSGADFEGRNVGIRIAMKK